MEVNKDVIKGRGLLFKMSLVSSVSVFLAILVLAGISIYSLITSCLESSVVMGNNKISGDINSFEFMLDRYYDQLNLKDGDLVDRQGRSLGNDHSVVDRISSDLGVEAAVFIFDHDEYRRISTSIYDNSGRRAVDSYLDTDSPVYSSMRSGKDHFERAFISGNEYITVYRPIFAFDTGENIGAISVGMKLSAIDNVVIHGTLSRIIKIMTGAAVVLLLLILTNTLICNAVLVKPIRSVVQMLKSTSAEDGDFTKRLVAKSNDEAGAVAYYYNLTMDKIGKLIAVIEQQSKALLDIGDRFAKNMTTTAEAMNKISANLHNADNLPEHSREFTDTMNVINPGNIQAKDVNGADEIDVKNREDIALLVQELSRFRV